MRIINPLYRLRAFNVATQVSPLALHSSLPSASPLGMMMGILNPLPFLRLSV